MNKKALQKILDELNKDKPNISYIKGIVEVLVEDTEDTLVFTPSPIISSTQPLENKSFKKPENSIGPDDPYKTINNKSSWKD